MNASLISRTESGNNNNVSQRDGRDRVAPGKASGNHRATMHMSLAARRGGLRAWLIVVFFALGCCAPMAKAAVLVHDFYLPMPEAQIRQTFTALESNVGTNLDSVFSVVVTGDGTVIYYDQWEDGYEVDLAHPTQSTTQVWGDGNDANGIPPGFAHDPVGLPAGAVIILRNLVPLPRNPANILFDARDRIAATKALVVCRMAWPTTPGSVLADAVQVPATIDYGLNDVSPVGQDMTNALFQYVALFVMAAEDGTSVTIDPDGAGAAAPFTVLLNRGESYLVNGGIKKGATVAATKPVQADLVVGKIAAHYASDWFTLYPVEQWGGSYATPVPTPASGNSTFVYVYNPNASAITINFATRVGSGSFSVPGTGGVYQYLMPKGSGARFTSAGGEKFIALCTVAARPGSEAPYDWGFTLLATDNLTTEAVVGMGLGSSDGTVDGSPVWVTPLANTRVYVDFNGDHNGPLTDPAGGKYDTNFDLVALQSQKIYDPDKDQTGMRLYTLDGNVFTTVWGEDPDVAAPGNPYIDAGTIVLPFPKPVLKKSSTIFTDNSPPGLSIGDVLEYTIELDNRGLLPLGNTVVIDAPPPSLSYVTNSTTLDGNPIPDSVSGTPFPLDAPGYTIPVILRGGTSTFKYRATILAAGTISNSVSASGYNLTVQNVVPVSPGGGSTQCTLSFSDAAGTPVATYPVGGNIYVNLADADANTDSNTVQTVAVVVQNTTRGDVETVTLSETGPNTGVFRNGVGLPTSASAGLAQQDGTLNVAAGDVLAVNYTDPVYGDTCNATAAVQAAAQRKVLYLSTDGSGSPDQDLDRVDPFATADNTTAQSVELGGGIAATIGLDNVSSNQTTASSLTFSHATGSGSNRLMLVGVSIDRSAASVSSVTYNGIALASVGSADNGTGPIKPRTEIWSLVNPPSGAHNVVVTFSGAASGGAIVGVATFTNVDQTTPLGTFASATGRSTTPSVTVSSATDQVVFDTIGTENTATLTPGAGQTQQWNLQPAIRGAGSTKAGSNSVTMSWTSGSTVRWAIGAVPVRPVVVGGTNSTTFTQTPAFCQNFALPAGGVLAVTNYVTLTGGSMPANPSITATLKYGANNVITLSSPAYDSVAGTLVWSSTLSSNVTVPSGQALDLLIANAQAGVSFKIDYDSAAKPSKVTLPTTTVIKVDTLGVYDAPYPGGNLVTAPAVGSTLYVRASVSDPFGAYDITSLGLAIDGPGTSGDVSATLNDAYVVASDGCSKIYEFQWVTGTTTGNYNISATANEGTEGITGVANASITLTTFDTGTPSATSFTSGNNGPATNAFAADQSVCVRVTDLDQNIDPSLAETLSVVVASSSGDSETLTLTETGTNTGVFTGCIPASTGGGAGTNNGTLNAPVGSVLTASYTDPNDPSDQSSATATVLPPPGMPGVTMNKSLVAPADGQAGVGETVQFDLQVINTGSTTLTNVSLTDNFPAANLAYQSASLAPSTVGAGTLAWNNVGPLIPGQSVSINVYFTATNTASPAVNTATANAGGGVTNVGSASVTITRSALTITKTLLVPTNGPVVIGSNVTFRIVVQNSGTTVIPTLPLEDTFSAGCYQFVSATVPPDGAGAGDLLWNDITGAGSLSPSATITIDVTLKVVGGCDPANNTAHADYAVDAYGDPVPPATSTVGVTTGAGRVTGSVYDDKDQSGTLTPGDVGLEGVTIQLFTDPNADGDPSDGTLVRLVSTESSGYYELLNLTTGAYVVVETDLPGFVSSAPVNNRLSVVLTSLTTNANNNFFDYLPNPVVYATVGGAVLNDANGNGTNDAGEAGIPNVTVELVQDLNTNGLADVGEPVGASVTTGTNGVYAFQNVTPGNYVIRETDIYGYYSTGDSRPPNDNQIGLAISSGITTNGNDFFDRLEPTAVNDTASAANNLPVTIYPLVNDISPNSDPLTIANAVTTNGIVVINSGSTNLTFTPTNLGVAIITYSISDGHGGTSSALITVNVTNTPPVAVNDTASTPVNVPLTINPLANDSDPNGDPLTIVSVSATNGVASIVGGTNVLFTPNTGFSGIATIGYTISDGNGGTASAVITVNISAVADLAVSKSGPANVFAGANFGYTITATNLGPSSASSVVVTDSLPTGVSFVSATPGATLNGSQVIWTNLGSLAADASSNLTVTVTAPVNGGSLTNLATVGSGTADTNAANNAGAPVVTRVTPVADLAVGKSGPAGIFAGTNFDYTITVTNLGPSTASSVVVTDSLPAGVSFVSAPPGATLNGSQVIWTNLGDLAAGAGTNLTLTVSATLRGTVTNLASAGSATLDTDAVNNVSAPVVSAVTNRPPVAVNDSVSTPKNVPVSVPVLVNDSDPDGDPLTIVNAIYNNTNGSAVVLGTNVVFTPATNFTGTASLSYTISDQHGGTASALITVSVTNRPPVANNDTASTPKNVPVTINPLANDSDPDNDPLTIVSVTPTNGVASIVGGTNVLFTPATNFTGGATIGYTISDGFGGTASAVITVNVLLTNHPPVAVNDNASTPKNVPVTISPLANDSDPDNDPLTITSVSPTNGAASILGGTNVLFTPATNFTGAATIGYTISDGNGGTASALITVSVTNRPPLANNDTYPPLTGPQLTVAAPGVLTNDTDPDGDALTAVLASATAHGSLTLNANGGFTYTPSNSYVGPDSFTYRASDGQATSGVATVSLAVPVHADLTVFKTGPTSGLAGSNLTFTITVTNSGPSTAVNVLLVDQWPAGYTFVSTVPPAASVSNNLVEWPLFDLDSLVATNFTVKFVASDGGVFTNLAWEFSNTPDYDSTNNDGSSTNAQVVTTVTPVADVAVFKTGPTNVLAGGDVTYTITVINSGPSTATNVVVADNLPSSATFQSASGSYSLSNGVVTWAGISLVKGGTANYTVTMTAPAGGSFVNAAAATSGTLDPDPTNNDGTSTNSRVTTTVTPVADVAVFKYGPTNVLASTSFAYTISVTNMGPSPAADAVVVDSLPTNLVFVSASAGGVFSNNVVTWPVLASLANGGTTNFTLTVTAPASGSFTNVAFSTADTFDPDLANNSGLLPGSRVSTTVTSNPPPQFSLRLEAVVLNRQTGLYEQRVTVTNNGATTVLPVRLCVGGLTKGVQLHNAAGTDSANGLPFVQYNAPLDPGANVVLRLEFIDPTRTFLRYTNLLYYVVKVGTLDSIPFDPNSSVDILGVFKDTRIPGEARFLIEFATITNRTYTIIYRDSLTAPWMVATPSVTAHTFLTQWYDDGPPKTESQPFVFPNTNRFYRVVLNP